jgi:hypothetical protein
MSEARVGRIEEETKNGKGRRIDLSEKAVERDSGVTDDSR